MSSSLRDNLNDSSESFINETLKSIKILKTLDVDFQSKEKQLN